MTNEEKYRQLVELSPVPMAVHVMGTVVLANQAAAELMGAKKPEALLGVAVLDYVHPDSHEMVKERIRLLVKGERQHTDVMEEKLIRLDGKVIDVEIVSLIIEYDGKPSIQIILHDITDKKRTQERLLQAKNEAEAERHRLYALFMATPAMVAIARGPDHVFELANPLYLEFTGKSPDIIGKPIREVFPELHGQGIFELLDEVYCSGEPFFGTETLIRLDTDNDGIAEDRYFNFVYLPSPAVKGEVDSILVHAVDVTFQVQARQEIENREKQYRSIFDATHDAILIFDTAGKLVEANPAALAMHGYAYSEIIGMSGLDLIHEDDRHVFGEIARKVMSGKTFRGVGRHRRKDGAPIVVEITGTGVTYRQAPHIMAVVRDVTERTRAEEELNYTNLILETVTNNASLGLFMMDRRQRCTFMNSAAEAITGYSLAEVQAVDRPLHDIIHHSHPDGTPYPIAECPIDRALPQKNRQTGEDIFVRSDGTFYPVRFTASPLLKEGKPVGTVIEVEDLTESLKRQSAFQAATKRRKELEAITTALRKQREDLLVLNQSKDEFISLASHQLRTPATGVKQYVAMALDGYAGDISPQLRLYLQRAYESNERQLSIVNDLLKVAQVDAGKVRLQKKTFDIVELVSVILRDSASRFNDRSQKVTMRHTQRKIIVNADEDRLRMALENIIDNASKYTAHGKAVKVTVAQLKTRVRVTIQDEGVGIDQADIEKVFQKFARIDNPFSTEVGGTGLGLYWTERIVSLHGGSITVKSKLGEGSSFIVDLPR